jgi:hypothetical protein
MRAERKPPNLHLQPYPPMGWQAILNSSAPYLIGRHSGGVTGDVVKNASLRRPVFASPNGFHWVGAISSRCQLRMPFQTIVKPEFH